MEDFSTIFKKAMMAETKRERKIFKRDLRPEYHIDGTAKSVMECIEGRVSEELYRDMMNYLFGYSDDMQLEIADNLLDAVCYGWRHYIGIPHIDMIMHVFYLLIEDEVTQQVN